MGFSLKTEDDRDSFFTDIKTLIENYKERMSTIEKILVQKMDMQHYTDNELDDIVKFDGSTLETEMFDKTEKVFISATAVKK